MFVAYALDAQRQSPTTEALGVKTSTIHPAAVRTQAQPVDTGGTKFANQESGAQD
jgi:hypothetical protein